MRIKVIALLIVMGLTSIMAQENYTDFAIEESARYKKGGVAMLATGVLMIGGGVAMFANEDAGDGTKVMGGAITAMGVGLDVGSIFMFRRSKQILDDAHDAEAVPVSFYVKPDGVQLTYRF